MTILINGLAQADSMSEIEAEESAQICGGFFSLFSSSSSKTDIEENTQTATVSDNSINIQTMDGDVNFISSTPT